MKLLTKLWGLIPPNTSLETATNGSAVRRSNSLFCLSTSNYFGKLSNLAVWKACSLTFQC